MEFTEILMSDDEFKGRCLGTPQHPDDEIVTFFEQTNARCDIVPEGQFGFTFDLNLIPL